MLISTSAQASGGTFGQGTKHTVKSLSGDLVGQARVCNCRKASGGCRPRSASKVASPMGVREDCSSTSVAREILGVS